MNIDSKYPAEVYQINQPGYSQLHIKLSQLLFQIMHKQNSNKIEYRAGKIDYSATESNGSTKSTRIDPKWIFSQGKMSS